MTDATPAQAPRRRRRGPIVLLVIVVILGLIVIAFFATDPLLRGYAEKRVVSEVSDKLPDTVVAHDLHADVGGGPVLAQYVSGRFSKVVLTSDDVQIRGTTVAARLVAHGVPVDTSKPVDRLDGRFTISQAALNQVVTIPGAANTDVLLQNGRVQFSPSFSVVGITITPTVTAKVRVEWPRAVVDPTNVKVGTNRTQLDVSTIAKRLLGGSIPVCIAQYLPEKLRATGVDIRRGEASATVTGRDVVLDAETFSTAGSCS